MSVHSQPKAGRRPGEWKVILKNKQRLYLFFLFAVIFIFLQAAHAADKKYSLAPEFSGKHGVAAGARMHVEHSAFKALPFDDGDFGYLLAYEYHEGLGLWQAGVEYAPSPDGDPNVNYVLTPQVSLIIQDRIFRAGIGVLWSYVARESTDLETPSEEIPPEEIIDGWSSPYYQFNIGLNFPFLERFSVGIDSYYVFEKWGKLKEFDIGDIEFGASFSMKF